MNTEDLLDFARGMVRMQTAMYAGARPRVEATMPDDTAKAQLGEREIRWQGPSMGILRIDDVPFALDIPYDDAQRRRLARAILNWGGAAILANPSTIAAFADQVLAKLDHAPFVMFTSAIEGWFRAYRASGTRLSPL